MKKIEAFQAQGLSRIFRKLRELELLQEKITEFIPPEWQAHCRVADFENGILSFAISNPARAARFRYGIPDLLKTLRHNAKLHALCSIDYYIEPEFERLFA